MVDKGRLTVVQSAIGVGKSTYAIGVTAYDELKEGLNVLHVTNSEDKQSIYDLYTKKRISDIEDELDGMTSKEIIIKAQQGFYENIVNDGLGTLEYEDVRKGLGKLKVIEVGNTLEGLKGVLEKVREDFKYDVVVLDSYYGVEDKENKKLLDLVESNEEVKFVVVRHIPIYVEQSIIKGEDFEYSHSKNLVSKVEKIITLAQEDDMRLKNEVYIIGDNKEEVNKKKYEVNYNRVKFEEVK